MYRRVVFLLGLTTVAYSLYVPDVEQLWELDFHSNDESNDGAPVELELGEEFADDFSLTTEGTYWQNGKTDNVWVHRNLSVEPSGLKPPSDRGYLEINFPSDTISYAHYHTKDVFVFPRGGVLQLDYFLTAKSVWDVQLIVQTMISSSHANLIEDLTDTFANSEMGWQSVEVEIPASNEPIRICIQGHRKRLNTTGLAIAKIVVRSNIDILDDYSKIVKSTNWLNDKTDNVWTHSNESSETSTSLRPPGDRGFIEINYPSNTTTFAHYHTKSQFTFPDGGVLVLDYWLVAGYRNDIQLKVNLVRRSSHTVTLSDLTSTFLEPQQSYWQTVNITIPASGEEIQICIQGHRKRLIDTGLAISTIRIHNNTNFEKSTIPPVFSTTLALETTSTAILSSTTEQVGTDGSSTPEPFSTPSFPVDTTKSAVSTTQQSPTGRTTSEVSTTQRSPTDESTGTQMIFSATSRVETSIAPAETTVIPFSTTSQEWTTQSDEIGLQLLDDFSEIVNSTNWRNNKLDNIWVHSSLSEETNAVLRPPEGRGFIEVNFPSTVNSYAHYHSVNYFIFPEGGNLQLDYWLRSNTKTDAQLRVFTLVAKSHMTTLADITIENSGPDAEWVTKNIAIPASNEKIQICIQGHRRQIDSTGLAIARILVENFREISIAPTEDYDS